MLPNGMPDVPASDVTKFLNRAMAGDSVAREQLAETLYSELRRMASRLMTSERKDHTLQATALAGDVYTRLIHQADRTWQNRAHFFAVAAKSMRRILVDYSRKKHAAKRGGEFHRLELDDALAASVVPREDFLALDQALTRLEAVDARQAQIIELRYFGGLTEEETAEVLGISPRTVKRDWSVARAWLFGELTRKPEPAAKAASASDPG